MPRTGEMHDGCANVNGWDIFVHAYFDLAHFHIDLLLGNPLECRISGSTLNVKRKLRI